MSDQQPDRPAGPTPGRNPLVTVLLILVGIILLLPGLCSLIFSVMMLKDAGSLGRDPGIQLLLFFCFVVGACGVGLIWFAIRRN
jgi:hypothetical protein